MDFQVIANNFAFLMLQGFLGFGAFAGGTLRLAIPAIVLDSFSAQRLVWPAWPAPGGFILLRPLMWNFSRRAARDGHLLVLVHRSRADGKVAP